MDTGLLIAKSPVEARLAELLGPSIEGMGYELVRLRLMGAGGRGAPLTLQVMAERPDGSMEIDDCAELSHAISAILDVEDPIEREYSLEVSSPGIDRPLTRAKDFATWAGYRARIEMALPIDTPTGPRRNFKGDLAGLEGETVSLDLDDTGRIALPLADVADAKLVLTDELIAESLKGRKQPDTSTADEIEYEDTDETDGRNRPDRAED